MQEPRERRALGVADLRRGLGPDEPGWPPNSLLVSSVDSTNLLARRLVSRLVEDDESVPDFVVVGLQQSAGRGRDGRSWWSPPGAGVYATWVTTHPAERVPWLPLQVPLGLCRAIDRFLPERCRIKWPNDLLVGDRKLGGVLIEAVRRAATDVEVLIGFGINLTHPIEEMPALRATSLERELGVAPPLAEVIRETVGEIGRELASSATGIGLVADFRARLAHAAGDRLRVRVGEEHLEGRFLGLDESGFLLLEVAGETRRIAAGEVVR